MIERRFAMVFFLLSCALQASAADQVLGTQEIKERQSAIRADLDAGKPPYAKLSRTKKQEILASQQQLHELLEGVSDTSQLDAHRRRQVFGLLSRIDARLDVTEDGLVCTQEARTGSNFVTRVCRTQAQIREQKAASDRMLGDERERMKCNGDSGCM